MSNTKRGHHADLQDPPLLDAVDAGLRVWRGLCELGNVDDQHVALVDAAGQEEPSHEDARAASCCEFLAVVETLRLAEVDLHAECVIRTRPRLAMLPIPRAHSVGVLPDVETMRERSSGVRPPAVWKTRLVQEAPDAVAGDADAPLDDAVGLQAVWRRAKMVVRPSSVDAFFNLSNPKPGHTTGGSGQVVARRGGAASGAGRGGTGAGRSGPENRRVPSWTFL